MLANQINIQQCVVTVKSLLYMYDCSIMCNMILLVLRRYFDQSARIDSRQAAVHGDICWRFGKSHLVITCSIVWRHRLSHATREYIDFPGPGQK